MIYRFDQKQDAAKKLKESMNLYLDNDKRIEFLTVSLDKTSKQKLNETFENYLPQLRYKKQFGRIDFFYVYVNHQHIHALLKKPFVPTKQLILTWQKYSNQVNLMIKTVKKTPDDIERICNYIITQGDKHNTYDVTWHISPFFGDLSPQERKKDAVSILKKQSDISLEEFESQKKQLIELYNNTVKPDNQLIHKS